MSVIIVSLHPFGGAQYINSSMDDSSIITHPTLNSSIICTSTRKALALTSWLKSCHPVCWHLGHVCVYSQRFGGGKLQNADTFYWQPGKSMWLEIYINTVDLFEKRKTPYPWCVQIPRTIHVHRFTRSALLPLVLWLSYLVKEWCSSILVRLSPQDSTFSLFKCQKTTYFVGLLYGGGQGGWMGWTKCVTCTSETSVNFCCD